MEEILHEDQMPVEEAEFREGHLTLGRELTAEFEEQVKNIASYEVIRRLRRELEDQIQEDFSERREKNNAKSDELCSILIRQF